MHRIISMRGAAVNSLKRLTIQRCTCAEHRLVWTATLNRQELLANKFKIQQIGQIECIRTQSTTPSTDVASRKRKRRKYRGSRFVELLQVTDNATKQTKTKVENLKARNLSEFVLTSNLPPSKKAKKRDISKVESKIGYQPVEYQRVNLEMLDNTAAFHAGLYDERPLVFFGKEVKGIKALEVNEILKSFNNFKEIIETIKDEYSEEMDYRGNKIVDEDKIEEKLDDIEASIEAIEAEPVKSKAKQKKKTLATKEKQQIYKSKFHVSHEQEQLAKHKSLQVNLNSYLNVCTSVGAINRGFSILLMYRQKYKKAGLDAGLFGIEPYNLLLQGYAETGNYEKIREICGVLKEDGIPHNHQTFAAIFECLGRLDPTENNINLVQKYKYKAENMGISMNDILDKSKFQFDQREIVLDAIQRVEPDFKPNYTPPVLTYSNRLLEQLNKHVQSTATPNITKDGTEIMNSKRGFTKKQLQEYARQQLRIELEGYLTVNSVEDNNDAGPNTEQSKQIWEELQKEWRNTICASINRDMTVLRAQTKYKPQGYMTYFTYLKTLEPSQYADILLKEIRMLAEGSETYSPTVNQLYRALGQKVYAKYQIEQKKKNGVLDKVGVVYARYCEKWEKCNTSDNPRQMWQRIVHENQHWGPSMNLEEKHWPNSALLGIGRFLYNILMRDIKINANFTKPQNKNKQRNLLPAFYTLFRNQGKNVKEEVKPHPILSRLLRSSRQKTLTFDANMVPMLCPPQPWSTPLNGGYLLTNSDLIRLPQQAVQQWSRIKNSNSQELYPALDSLNQLASIPWRVNSDVLDVILEVFKKGGNDKLDVPQHPSSLPPLPTIPVKNSDMTSAERFQRFRQKMFHKRKQGEMYSLWCDTLYRLSLANHYRDKVFWLPHNMDFRGRVYPVPPHLNHLGSDLARSMLVFDQAQPLGTDGFSWLKLHCINLTGLKKRDSIRERLLYAEEIMDDIIDSAENPLTGRKWWTKSDEPWQTLACCMEIAKVRKCPDPEKYMCRLPIHQDGSCNGLQHYAALGRDKSGAISVNLAPSTTPQDVYSAVAALVEKTRQTDAENGLHVAQILNGYVRRKVIKQTVMTTVYGVTRYGARLQIAKQLKDIDEFPREWVWPASTYLTTKTFESLREMFTSTKEIQDWFTECARMISSVCGQNVEWITPLGLPVVQPYSRYDAKKVSPKDGNKLKERVHMDMYEKPNIMKQKNAFPPNFIHSLDSSHMMLTSLYCERKGVTFVSVHDCFWTHACTVPDMNKICREQFVALHSEPILEDLSKFLTQKYSFSEKVLTNDGSAGDITKQKLNTLLEKIPDKGDFDLEKVLESIYFFS